MEQDKGTNLISIKDNSHALLDINLFYFAFGIIYCHSIMQGAFKKFNDSQKRKFASKGAGGQHLMSYSLSGPTFTRFPFRRGGWERGSEEK